ncbi:MAG: acyl-CoA dehydrogenase family protein [bacterium]|nr:acyl-CoA dehydrogenase family protein [bacterium]
MPSSLGNHAGINGGTHVPPFVQAVPREAIDKIAEAGFLGGIMPVRYGGGGWDAVSFGLLNEAFGRAATRGN